MRYLTVEDIEALPIQKGALTDRHIQLGTDRVGRGRAGHDGQALGIGAGSQREAEKGENGQPGDFK